MACLLLLTGCVSPSGTSDVRRGAVILWHTMTGERERALLWMLDAWNASGRGVTIVAERQPADEFGRRVQDGGRRGALPHLMLASPAQAAEAQALDLLAPMDSIESKQLEIGWGAETLADLQPFVLTAGRTPQGGLIGVAMGGSARVLIYNRDLLRSLNLGLLRPPVDWENFSTACARVSDPSRGLACLGVEQSAYAVEEWVSANAGETVSRSGVVGITSPASRAAFERLRAFVESGQAYYGAEPGQLRDDFAAARTLYLLDWTDRIAQVGAQIHDRDNFAWGIATLPSQAASGPGATAARVPYTGALWVVPKSGPSTQAAVMQFVRWWLEPTQTVRWALKTGDLPARRSAISTAEKSGVTLTPEQLEVWRVIAPVASPVPLFSGLPCAQDAFVAALRQVEDGSRTVDEALQAAAGIAAVDLARDCS